MRKKKIWILLGVLMITVAMGGCKKEPTQEEVEKSEYYTDLLSQYNKLKKQNQKLSAQLEEATAEKPEDTEAKALLDKISRDSLIKMEIVNGGESTGSVFTENKGVLKLANQLASAADVVDLYTADDVWLNYEHLYSYTLYDEDNSVFEMDIYDGNYVIFQELPEKVFYVYDADKFGNSFLKRQKYYPTLSGRALMAETDIIINGQKAYDKKTAYEVVCYIDAMEKKTIKEKTVKQKLTTEYLFYNHAEIVSLKIGKTVIQLKYGEKTTCYKTDAETIKNLRKIFINNQAK